MLKIKGLLAKLTQNALDTKTKLDTISDNANYLHLEKVSTSFSLTFPSSEITISANIPLTAPDSTCTVPISIAGWYINNNWVAINGMRIQGNESDGYRLMINCRHHNRTSSSAEQVVNGCYVHILWKNPDDAE